MGLYYFMLGDDGIKISIPTAIFAALLSFALLLGESFHHHGGFSFFQSHPAVAAVLFLVNGVIAYVIALFAVRWLSKPVAAGIVKKPFALLDQKPFLSSLIIIFICWLPVWLVFFPGTTTWDGIVQLAQPLGVRGAGWSDAHPVFGSLVYGALFNFGRLFGSDDAGLFVIVLFQKLLMAGVFAFAIARAKAWGASFWLRFAVLMFFALMPIFPFHTQAFIKDNPATSLLVLYFILYMDLIKKPDITVKGLLWLLVAAVFASLVRGNNFYVVLLSLPLLSVMKLPKPQKFYPLIATMVFAMLTLGTSAILRNVTGASPGGVQEALSIPFQQTARFARYHPELVTDEHIAAIDPVLYFATLAQRYDPGLSDPVKWAFWDGDSSLLPAYFRVWWQQFWLAPGTYFAATIANSYAYFAPVRGLPDNRDFVRPHHTWAVFYTWHEIPADAFSFSDSHNQPMRYQAYHAFNALRQGPISSIFFQLANYTWFILFLMLLIIKKGIKKDLLAFVPVLLLILSCIASPVNGEVRYFLPAIAAAPILLLYVRGRCFIEGE